MGYGAMRSHPASEEDDCASLSPITKYSSAFNSRSSHSRHSLPEEIVAEILLRLPAKSVARFRCVSTTWLSIATDPSFILAHALRARKSLLFRSFSKFKRPFGPSYYKFFSFSARDFSCAQLSREQIFDEARSSCNGLVLFLRWDKQPPSPQHYLMNPLTGLIIDIPDPDKGNDYLMELYYHRWTGEYRLLYFREYINFITGETKRLDAEVLSLAGACPSPSWRQINAKVPTISLFYNQSRILVNDRLYWMGQDFSQAHTILVFDILKETFSLMEPPSYGRNALPPFADSSCSKFGFVDIAGTLCFWVVYRDKSCMENVTIHVWAAVDGDEKWKNTYSLCYNDEWLWAFLNPFNTELSLDCCLCVRESELLFLFDGRRNRMKSNRLAGQDVQYFFHWDLKSGKYWTEPLPAVMCVQLSSGIVHKETLVTAPFLSTAAITRFLP